MSVTSVATRRVPLWRKLLVGFLVVVGLVFALAGNLTLWTTDTVLDTDTFVETLEPLPEQEAVAQAIADRATEEIVEAADTDTPELLRQQIADAAATVIASEQFNEIWVVALRTSHGAVRAVLLDEPDIEGLELVDGQIVLNLDDTIAAVQEELAGTPLEGTLGEVPPDAGQVVIVEESDLVEVRETVQTFDTLGVLVPVISLVLLVVALVLAWGFRRRTLIAIGFGLAIVMAITLIALSVAKPLVTDLIEDADVRRAGQEAWDVLLRDLRQRAWIIFGIGLAIGIGGLIAGPSRWATALRRKVGGWTGRGGGPSPEPS